MSLNRKLKAYKTRNHVGICASKLCKTMNSELQDSRTNSKSPCKDFLPQKRNEMEFPLIILVRKTVLLLGNCSFSMLSIGTNWKVFMCNGS